MEIISLRSLAFISVLAIWGCGSNDKPEPAAIVSLVAPTPTEIRESENERVRISISLDRTVSTTLTAPLSFSGSATRNADYTVSADSVVLAPRTTSASVDIDVFRDFDMEGEEAIVISLGIVEGNGTVGTTSSIQLTIIDGESANVDKTQREEEANLSVASTHYIITEDSIDFGVVVANFSNQSIAPTQLFVEWSTDADFQADVNSLGVFDNPAFVPGETVFSEPYEFSLPVSSLAPNETYHIRAYLGEVPEETSVEAQFDNVIPFSFATNAVGKVATRCEAPARASSDTESDPLFAEQWHLQNSGQSGFSNNNGVAGADLQMTETIRDGRNGNSVKLAVVDTGLEICHPDLAANVEEGKSFNAAFQTTAGSSITDPFNFNTFGDHGTSVAGVAGAVANNGFGGRGVAPDVELRAFNFSTSLEADPEVALLKSLGGSSRNPDSASAHIFNMSFGVEEPFLNPAEDFVKLFKMGTTDLRSGRGALYVKAAGNSFDFCSSHPLNAEIGCVGSNTDPDQNLPYLITVGAFNAKDVRSSYSSAGANLWVVAPGGEDGEEHPAIITTDQIGIDAGFPAPPNSLTTDHPLNRDGDYTSVFGGTSAAAPAAAGAIAILLGMNPDLTWRDVKHILAASARKIDPDIAEVRAAFNGKPYIARHAWQTNSAGYSYHNWYGFGAIAVDNAVTMAESHTPNSLGEFVESEWFSAVDDAALPLTIPDGDGAGITHSLTVVNMPNTANIEAVILDITLDHSYGSDLGIKLTSPGGTESVVNPPFNVILAGVPALGAWQLMSNAFYGEEPNGIWTIQVVDLAAGDMGSLMSWRLRFYYGEHP